MFVAREVSGPLVPWEWGLGWSGHAFTRGFVGCVLRTFWVGRSGRNPSQMEASEVLGVSERTFRRWRDRYGEEGPSGLADRRLRPSLRQAPKAEIERMLGHSFLPAEFLVGRP